MDLSAIIRAVITPSEEGSPANLPPLQPGDHLMGRVVQLEADGRVLIDLGRFRALAQTSFKAQPGQIMQLCVVKTGIPLHLRVVPGPAGDGHRSPCLALAEVLEVDQHQRLMQIMEDYINSPGPRTADARPIDESLRQSMAQIRTMLEPMALDGSDRQVAQILGRALDQCGLFYENKLAEALTALSGRQIAALLEEGTTASQDGRNARQTTPPDLVHRVVSKDIKAQLMLLKFLLSQSGEQAFEVGGLPAKDLAFLHHGIERLLVHVQEQQARLIRHGSQADMHQVISYSWPVRDHARPVRLKIYYPRKGRHGGSPPPHRVALLLDMERLGPLRADLVMLERNLRVDFYVRSKAVLDLLEGHFHTIKETLEGNFDQVLIAAYLSEEKIARFDQEDAQGAGVGRIDIQI